MHSPPLAVQVCMEGLGTPFGRIRQWLDTAERFTFDDAEARVGFLFCLALAVSNLPPPWAVTGHCQGLMLLFASAQANI